jgi:hypothetical protein
MADREPFWHGVMRCAAMIEADRSGRRGLANCASSSDNRAVLREADAKCQS